MKKTFYFIPFAAVATLCVCGPALAQTTTQTKVSHDTSMTDGVATTKTTVSHTSKTKTRHPRKILGVKVGHKSVVHKTVKKTSVDSNGNTSTTVKTQ